MTERHRVVSYWAPRETANELQGIPRYLRMISLGKLLVGVLVLALLAVVIVLPLLEGEDGGMRIILSQLPQSESDEMPRMLNPRYEGIDAENQPFTIRAQQAIQQDAESVRLIGLQGDIALKSGNWLALEAEQGLLQIMKKKLLLQGKVHLYSDDGNEFTTNRVLVNLETGDAWGPDPVSAQGQMGTISAGGFQMSTYYKAIRFTKRVKLVLYP